MALKAKEILEVRRKFDFVAPVLAAKVKSRSHFAKNRKDKITDEGKENYNQNSKENSKENNNLDEDSNKQTDHFNDLKHHNNIKLIDDENLLNNSFELSEFSTSDNHKYSDNHKNNIFEFNHNNHQYGLDLNQLLAPQPNKLFIVQVTGESMIDENIFDGDLLLVDKYDTPNDGKIIIASINGELVVKKLKKIDGKIYLFSANAKFLPIEILPLYNFQIQGVVKHVIHSV